MPTAATPRSAYSATTAPSWRSTWRTYGQWLQRNITSRARPSRSASFTVVPSADGSSKSCAGVPSGTISEETAMGSLRLPVRGGPSHASGHGLPLHAGGQGGVQALPPAVGLRGQGAPRLRARPAGSRPRPGAGRPRRPGRLLLLPRHVGLAALGGAAAGPAGA